MTKEKFIYSAYELTKESKDFLKQVLINNNLPIYSNEFLHHCTIEFGSDTLDNSLVDKQEKIFIIGYCQSKDINCFIVKQNLSTNKFPHITISANEGIKPFQSNVILESEKHYYFNKEIEVKTIIKKYFGN